MSKIILASASPRRRELMENMGLRFEVVVTDADESSADSSVPPEIYVQELALIKAAAAAKKSSGRKDAVVISADTVVVNNGEIMGKPKDEEDAKRMLGLLSGRTHSVYTGFCVMRMSDAFTVCKNVRTDVTFRELNEDKIDRYVKTGESADKAGAYGIQGMGAMLTERINGDYFNVVGLPVGELADVLETEFGFKLM